MFVFVNFIHNDRYLAEGIGENSARNDDDPNRKHFLLDGLRSDIAVADGEHGDDRPVETRNIHWELVLLVEVVKGNPGVLSLTDLVDREQVEETAAEVGQVQDFDNESYQVEEVHVEVFGFNY